MLKRKERKKLMTFLLYSSLETVKCDKLQSMMPIIPFGIVAYILRDMFNIYCT